MSDRQWSKKRPSDQQAQGQNIRLFVAITRIATDRLWGRFRPEIDSLIGVSLGRNT